MITWTITSSRGQFGENVNQSTLDGLEGLLSFAAQYWERYINAQENVTIELRIGFLPFFGGIAASGSADGALLIEAENGARFFIDSVPLEIITGQDITPDGADGSISIEPDIVNDFYFDTDIFTLADIPADRIDAFTVLMREVGRVLGFNSLVGTSQLPNEPDGIFTTFDLFVVSEGGTFFFTGPNAVANFGGPVPLNDGTVNGDRGIVFGAAGTELLGNDNFRPGAELLDDLLAAQLLPGQRKFISSLDVAILSDIGLPTRQISELDDEIFGFELEADLLRGLSGDDTLYGLGGNDFITGGLGADIVFAGAGNDQVFAGAVGSGDDVFVGGAGADTIGGGDGDDLLIGGGFDDGATAQLVTDTLAGVEQGDGVDVIFGGDGNDTLIGGGFIDRTVDNGSYNQGEALASSLDANTLYAGTGDDLVVGASGNDTIGGGAGDDTLQGGNGNDVFYGGRGDADDTGVNDVILAGGGNDQVFAGAGDDSIDGGAGNDELFNGGGDDTVDGGAGNDTLFGGPGDDVFTGGLGADTLEFFAGNGNDTITDFDTGEDTLELNGTATDFTDLASVQAASTNATQGGQTGLLIETGDGDSVFLIGLTIDDLSTINVVF